MRCFVQRNGFLCDVLYNAMGFAGYSFFSMGYEVFISIHEIFCEKPLIPVISVISGFLLIVL